MRALLFDFGGTLDTPRHWLDRFVTHYHAAGLPITRAELNPAFDSATNTAYRSTALLRDYSLAQLIPYLVGLQLAFIGDTDGAKFDDRGVTLSDSEGRSDFTARISRGFVDESIAGMAASRTVIRSLAKDFKIGIVSNFYGNLQRILLDAEFGVAPAAITDSSRIGIFKPSAGIFQAALTAMRVSPDQTIMVGDSLNKDCAPARALGMRTVWLRHQEATSRRGPLEAADFTISSLAELQELVCGMR